MPAVRAVGVAEDLHAAVDRHARGVPRHQDHALLPVPVGRRVGLAHHDEDARSRGLIAPDDHHLRPLMTYSSPSRVIRVAMLVASEEATSGSVMQNAERICPSSNGLSQRVALLRGAELGQQLHVAGVGGGAVERRAGRARATGP